MGIAMRLKQSEILSLRSVLMSSPKTQIEYFNSAVLSRATLRIPIVQACAMQITA
jgi:hypothetical protein